MIKAVGFDLVVMWILPRVHRAGKGGEILGHILITHLYFAFIVYPPRARYCAGCWGYRDEQNIERKNTFQINI